MRGGTRSEQGKGKGKGRRKGKARLGYYHNLTRVPLCCGLAGEGGRPVVERGSTTYPTSYKPCCGVEGIIFHFPKSDRLL